MARGSRLFVRSVAASLLVGALAGCHNFLNQDNLQHDPNNPTTAGLDNLFISAQTNLTVEQTGQLARVVCIWMQQCSGQIGGFAQIDIYGVGEDDFYTLWAQIYGGGGLIDLRTVQQKSLTQGDSIFAGAAAVIEAMQMSLAADVWGDVPYKEAAQPDSFKTPNPDAQAAVYDSLLTKLASAIVGLQATGPTNFGPVNSDLIYAGDGTKWAALAHTVRARIWLHRARVIGTAAYDSAFVDAQQGIQQGDDYISINNSAPTSSNLWSQFTTIYADNIAAGAYLVNYLADSGSSQDPRLAQYFSPTSSTGDFVGARPGQSLSPDAISTFNPDRVDAGFQQPIVTWAENQLIAAEAALQKSAPDAGAAATFLHAEQDAAGAANTSATLHNIMLEKYIVLFQNVELWNDWKRTNLPALVPAPGGSIPRRLVYPLSERQVNPNLAAHDPGNGRNPNDP
jgi:hypothetical protein